jgi:YHS domain-containing protein
MLGWALKLLLLLLVIRAVLALLRGVWGGLVNAARVPEDEETLRRETRGTLVQDPVCGTFVVRDRALSVDGRGGAQYYFCSEECRRSFSARGA